MGIKSKSVVKMAVLAIWVGGLSGCAVTPIKATDFIRDGLTLRHETIQDKTCWLIWVNDPDGDINVSHGLLWACDSSIKKRHALQKEDMWTVRVEGVIDQQWMTTTIRWHEPFPVPVVSLARIILLRDPWW